MGKQSRCLRFPHPNMFLVRLWPLTLNILLYNSLRSFVPPARLNLRLPLLLLEDGILLRKRPLILSIQTAIPPLLASFDIKVSNHTGIHLHPVQHMEHKLTTTTILTTWNYPYIPVHEENRKRCHKRKA